MALATSEFFFEGMPVGYFEGSEYPRSPGRYRYVPYRGPGHYEMQTQLRASGCPRCYYEVDGTLVSFAVLNCPEPGVLELSDFEESQPNTA